MNELLIGIAATAGAGWLGWMTVTTIQSKERINDLRTNATSHDKDMEEIKESFKTLLQRVEASNDKIGQRLDLFLKTEIQEFKGVADDVANALKSLKK